MRDPANYQVQTSFIKECELKMLENSMLNKLFQHTRDTITINSLQLCSTPTNMWKVPSLKMHGALFLTIIEEIKQ